MAINKVKTAVVGCGAISGIYFENMVNMFHILEVAACCDLNQDLEKATADKYKLKRMTLEEIIQDKSIELVINLTTPAAHFTIIKALLTGGKHVYTEKVLAVNLSEAKELVELASEKHLYLGAAPDTFLGEAVQTARFVVDSGMIGTVTSCYAALNRDCNVLAERFPYTALQGGGIGIDVGIYYITALLSILGSVTEVSGVSKTREPKRCHYFVSKNDFEKELLLESENIMAGTIEFESGVIGSLHFNANCIQNEQPQIVLYGTEGILYLPDPNKFGGNVKILVKGQTEPFIVPPLYAYGDNCRGLGAAEMAQNILKLRQGR